MVKESKETVEYTLIKPKYPFYPLELTPIRTKAEANVNIKPECKGEISFLISKNIDEEIKLHLEELAKKNKYFPNPLYICNPVNLWIWVDKSVSKRKLFDLFDEFVNSIVSKQSFFAIRSVIKIEENKLELKEFIDKKIMGFDELYLHFNENEVNIKIEEYFKGNCEFLDYRNKNIFKISIIELELLNSKDSDQTLNGEEKTFFEINVYLYERLCEFLKKELKNKFYHVATLTILEFKESQALKSETTTRGFIVKKQKCRLQVSQNIRRTTISMP